MINLKTKDINILISMVNTELRDNFKNLDDLISYYEENKEELLLKMTEAGYIYQVENNQFVRG